MKYLLDTNVCIGFLKGHYKIKQQFKSANPSRIFLCSIVRAELFTGSYKSNDPMKSLTTQLKFIDQFGSYDFDSSAALHYAEIRADLEKKGTTIGAHDYQIAAIALAKELTLVTHNTKEFKRVGGLSLTDWEI